MVKQLVKIEPITEIVVAALDGAQGYRQQIPDVNKYGLQATHQFSDSRHITPTDGFNTQVWIVEGTDKDIDKFIAENATIVSKISPADAKLLADNIMPGKTSACTFCGGTGIITRPAWTSPI